ncbi:hypothetical protein ASD39_04125 [Sphingomonas sp. Root50]|nr:hypothetical protein ASD17_07605 [Sphingomonas sp. Root1294]KQY68597.1 hypothetical protein ASD39_04125 [Sphingomonas sp. Root50]
MRAAVESNPDDIELLLDLVIALRNAGRQSEIVDRLAPKAASHGLPPELAVELGAAANLCGDTRRARMALEMAMDDGAPGPILRDPAGRSAARQRARVELASVLTAAGQHDAALRAVTAALDLNPHDDAALSMAADQMLKQGRAPALIALLDDLEMRGVRSAMLLSCRANALGACGAHAELERLVSPSQWCVQAMIGPDEVDNRRLAEVILTHPALVTSPGDRPTRGTNHRLDAIASREEPEIRAIVSTIRRHVDAYVAARRDVPHPLMSHMPAAAVLQGWALATNGDGHEARHIHARSWITAVYYARVPVARRRAAGPPPGSIVFGPWPSETHRCAGAFPAWHLEPREGMLLIFPSFMAHSTVPSDVDEPRLCVTLDTMPQSLPA